MTTFSLTRESEMRDDNPIVPSRKFAVHTDMARNRDVQSELANTWFELKRLTVSVGIGVENRLLSQRLRSWCFSVGAAVRVIVEGGELPGQFCRVVINDLLRRCNVRLRLIRRRFGGPR